MADPSEPEMTLASSGALVAVAVTVLGGLLQPLFYARGLSLSLTAMAMLYLVLASLGWPLVERHRPGALPLLLVTLTLLALPIMWLSRLDALLILMPLVSMIVLYSSTSWALAASLLFVVEGEVWAAAWHLPLRNRLGIGFAYVPALAFVITFSRLVLREREARLEARRQAARAEQLGVTAERNRIAREIHDTVGHYLTVVHVQIAAARALLANEPSGADDCLVRAETLVRDGLAELRRSVGLLRSGAIAERPFGVALAGLVEECRAAGIEAALSVVGEARPLPPAVEFALYRAAQEALTNTRRHAQAKTVAVVVRYAAADVTLHVSDDGIGAATTDGGFGLTGVRERVGLVGGSVTVDTAAGRGFALEVRIPQ